MQQPLAKKHFKAADRSGLEKNQNWRGCGISSMPQ
jgi:hypothetical protein